jgi:hypothetical protein
MDQEERDGIIEQLSEKHDGRIEAYETDDGYLIVIAPPTNAHVEYKRFSDAIQRKESVSEAQETYVQACIVYPAPDVARRLLRRYPAMAPEIARDASDLLSGGLKKLGKVRKKPNETT